MSAIDDRTRDAHRSLDGVEVGVTDDFHSANGGQGKSPGMMGTAADDVNCRCTFFIQVAGFKPEFRRIRGEGVVPYTTYDDWAKAKGV